MELPTFSPDRPVSPCLQAQLEVLRAAYAARLDEKIEVIAGAWERYLASRTALQTGAGSAETTNPATIAAAPGDREILKELHRAAHTLAGSGATFGFPAVSRAARRAEVLLKPLAQDEIPLNPDLHSSIEGCLAELRRSSGTPEEVAAFSGPPDSLVAPPPPRTIYLFSDTHSGAPTWAASLEAFGYGVKVFHSAAALGIALEARRPAALVIDCESEPLLCGQGAGDSNDALLAPVLANAERSAENPVPVVWVCAHGDLRSRLQSVRLGGAAFFAQPVDVDSLLVKLDDLTAHIAPEPFRVLVVDDDPSLGRLFSIILRQAGMETCIVNDPLQIMAPLVDFRPDVILMDLYMPGCSGVEIASVIRQQEAYIGIPIMYLSVENDLSKQLEAMRQGGDDFLSKPVQPRHLVAAVTTRATRARALRNLMVRDSLTGLLNHTKIKEQLEIELSRARRVGQTVCLAMLDIDHFKIVNDRYGHATGDRVLRSLSRLLGQRLRQTDVIGRYGGEEFAVILTGSGVEDARLKLETVRQAFANLSHFCDGREFRVTFSAGIASAPPPGDSASLSEAADRALYEAKRAGRNCIVVAK